MSQIAHLDKVFIDNEWLKSSGWIKSKLDQCWLVKEFIIRAHWDKVQIMLLWRSLYTCGVIIDIWWQYQWLWKRVTHILLYIIINRFFYTVFKNTLDIILHTEPGIIFLLRCHFSQQVPLDSLKCVLSFESIDLSNIKIIWHVKWLQLYFLL